MKAINTIIFASLAMLLCMCKPSVPSSCQEAGQKLATYPDYDGVTVPPNIAPLNFAVADDKPAVARIHGSAGQEMIVKGPVFNIPIDKWHALLNCNKDSQIAIDVYQREQQGWVKYEPIVINVASEDIDPYIAYRLIEPGYAQFETMAICERCLENFDEREIFNNRLLATQENGQCINCHSFQAYNSTGNMQMHARINNGGTLIFRDGQACKINLKTPVTISAGVYPSWHPTLPLIAYSVNSTTQNFHSRDLNKVEVQDDASDLILYDAECNSLQIIADDPNELETFPYWNHDGTALYYVSAKLPEFTSQEEKDAFRLNNYKDFKYNIYRRPFDAATRSFGAVDTIYMASDSAMSATFPRESPDGRYLMFTMAEYGTFHIWHRDADLYLMDLADGSVRNMAEINSDNVESYHSWSSAGRWIIFSSRRDDGSFTRLYISYFDKDGKAGKPFLLPQRNPEDNKNLYKSYNVPEFLVAPAVADPADVLKAMQKDPISPSY